MRVRAASVQPHAGGVQVHAGGVQVCAGRVHGESAGLRGKSPDYTVNRLIEAIDWPRSLPFDLDGLETRLPHVLQGVSPCGGMPAELAGFQISGFGLTSRLGVFDSGR